MKSYIYGMDKDRLNEIIGRRFGEEKVKAVEVYYDTIVSPPFEITEEQRGVLSEMPNLQRRLTVAEIQGDATQQEELRGQLKRSFDFLSTDVRLTKHLRDAKRDSLAANALLDEQSRTGHDQRSKV